MLLDGYFYPLNYTLKFRSKQSNKVPSYFWTFKKWTVFKNP